MPDTIIVLFQNMHTFDSFCHKRKKMPSCYLNFAGFNRNDRQIFVLHHPNDPLLHAYPRQSES